MDPNVLLKNRSLRLELCNDRNTIILEKLGNLRTMPQTGWSTTEQVAEFFETTVSAIKLAVKRHRDEFKNCGYKILQKGYLAQFPDVTKLNIFRSDNYRIAIFSRPSILLCGCLLRDSFIAKGIRAYLIQAEFHSLTQSTQNFSSNSQYEQRLSKLENTVAELSQQMEAMSQQVNSLENRLIHWDNCFVKLQKELDNLKAGSGKISEQQVELLKTMIKAKKKPYIVWRKFKSHFKILSYSDLCLKKWEDALAWLHCQK